MNGDLDRTLRSALEVILFSVTEPVSSYQIAKLLEEGGWGPGESVTPGQVERYIQLLMNDWDAEGRPLTVLRIAGGYQMATRPEWAGLVARLQEDKRSHRLSRAALETLAIVAYKQPVIRPDIDAIRGVNSDSALKTLLEKDLVAISGRDDGPGRPLLYRTTTSFLKYFGLDNLHDLPDPDELAAILGVGLPVEPEPPEGESGPETEPQLELATPLTQPDTVESSGEAADEPEPPSWHDYDEEDLPGTPDG